MGAKLYGGRWNPIGIEVIYASASISLAVLEVLVNTPELPADYTLTEIHIPAHEFVEYVPDNRLPQRWNSPTDFQGTRRSVLDGLENYDRQFCPFHRA